MSFIILVSPTLAYLTPKHRYTPRTHTLPNTPYNFHDLGQRTKLPVLGKKSGESF